MVTRNSSLEQVPHAKISTDYGKVSFLTRHVRARALSSDYLHSGRFRQTTGNLILHADGEIRVFAIRTQIFERQNGDRPFDFGRDRKSTRLNSSHLGISYAVFCLKKK